MVPVTITKVDWSPTLGNNVIELKEINGNRTCTLIIPEWEAPILDNLIHYSKQEVFNRLELFCDIIKKLNARILRVEIRRNFFRDIIAQIVIIHRKNKFKINSPHPAEAIELALRCQIPVWIIERLLENEPAATQSYQPRETLQELKLKLEKAIEEENYELAAKLRDKILKLESKRNWNN